MTILWTLHRDFLQEFRRVQTSISGLKKKKKRILLAYDNKTKESGKVIIDYPW